MNFRDLGGYAAEDGRRTRWRVLFRADGLGELTEGDLSVMRSLGIRTVIDLRSATELERGRFDVDAHPVAFHHFPFIEELPDAEEFDRRPGLLGSQYQEILRDAGPQIIAVLEVLSRPMRCPPCSTAPPARTARASSPRSSCPCSGWTSPRWWPTTP